MKFCTFIISLITFINSFLTTNFGLHKSLKNMSLFHDILYLRLPIPNPSMYYLSWLPTCNINLPLKYYSTLFAGGLFRELLICCGYWHVSYKLQIKRSRNVLTRRFETEYSTTIPIYIKLSLHVQYSPDHFSSRKPTRN